MSVGFDPEAGWSHYTGCYTLWAADGDEPIACLIPRTVFAECFDKPHPTLTDIETLFRRNRRPFEAAFQHMIEAGHTVLWPDALAEGCRRQVVLTPASFADFINPEPPSAFLHEEPPEGGVIPLHSEPPPDEWTPRISS